MSSPSSSSSSPSANSTPELGGVAWRVDNHGYLWPLDDLGSALPQKYRLSKIFVRGRDDFEGCKVDMEYSRNGKKFIKSYSIPMQYEDVLGIINSKIMWLQAFLARRKNKGSRKSKETLAILHDSVSRTLKFDFDI